jgi:hypothetical protein
LLILQARWFIKTPCDPEGGGLAAGGGKPSTSYIARGGDCGRRAARPSGRRESRAAC